MQDRVPSFFLLVPGPWGRAQELVDALRGHGLAADLRGAPHHAEAVYVDVVYDDQLGAGFSWGRDGPLPAELVAEVDACSTAALVEVIGRLDERTARVAALGRALRTLGGVAVRMEASGFASPWEPWLERLETGGVAGAYHASVIIVRDEGAYFTCGMHQFDRPEAEITLSDPRASIRWLDSFCIFQLAEQPALASGHTFRPDDESPHRVLERWPDHRHPPDDGRHNAFGIWRFLPEGAEGLEAQNPVPTIVPSLLALLRATESSKGRPLSQSEVEGIVRDAPATAMDLRDATVLEQRRGYADIEPRLAFEQWQIVREMFES